MVWADASKGRVPVSEPEPKLPAWVSTEGLALSVSISFVLMPDGLVSGVSLEKSSGNAEVDSAIKYAISRWRFTAAKGAAPVKGRIPHYVIKFK